ncbi:MAG: C1 family peptidase [Bacteroidales bacterium]|nr:C1 family peptidase [Bacteroidales bacterium]
MKKFFAILLIAGMGSFVMNSCQKSADVKLNNDQQVSTQHSLGCNLLPAEEYAKIPVVKDPVGFASKTVVTLACPPVGNQGGEGSCVAWGSTYAARSILWHKDHVAAYSQSVNIFSPEYVYNQIKASSSCTSGSYVTDALSLLYNQGVCRWSLMPYTDVSCSTLPNATQKADAKLYWTNSYGAVTISTSAFKAQLNAGFPIIVAGPVNNAYMNLGSGVVLSTFSGSSLGGHCQCIVGYDDTKSAFKVMNSWGTSWGSAGFGWIKYGYETSWWTEAYVMGN